jgi:hypothetical protein
MAEMSDLPPSTEVYSDSGELPLAAKVSFAVVAAIGFVGLVVCLGE